jgi:hypothetical protein
MPIRILPASEKRKAKRGQTEGGRNSSWKRPYKDYTKIKHTNLIQTLDGRKKGQIQEQSGAPGGEKKLHDKSMKRLNELQKLKSRSGTRMTSGAQRKRKEHLQSGGYKTGGKAAKKLTGNDPVVKWLAGGVKGKPHSSKEGRLAAAGRKFSRIAKKIGEPGPARPPRRRPKPGGPLPRPGKPGKPDPRRPWKREPGWPKREPMVPLRAKHGVGSLVKGAVKGVKKLKGQLKKDKGLVYAGAGVGGWELGKKTSKKVNKKASGGRIGFKHGGSVGAAVRGHGAEIK